MATKKKTNTTKQTRRIPFDLERKAKAEDTLDRVRKEKKDKEAARAVEDSPFYRPFDKDEAIQGARLVTRGNCHALLVKHAYGAPPDQEIQAVVFDSPVPQAGQIPLLRYYNGYGDHTGPGKQNPELDLFILHDKAVVRRSELSPTRHPAVIDRATLYQWDGEDWSRVRKARPEDYQRYPKLIRG